MFNILITIIGLVALAGNFLPFGDRIWDDYVRKFGAISYPASLDSFTNPNGTDSVATVSHSAQHSNANDAIEALQTKLGISASTAVSNSVLAGNGTGSSGWTTTPTLSTLNLSGLGTFNSFISQASSTIVGDLTITGNSITTNATSTIGAFTNYATSTKYYGAGLSTCTAGSFLTWSGGSYGCGVDNTGAITIENSDIATSSTSIDQARGPYNVVAGDKFLLFGKVANGGDGSSLLQYKQTNDAASTTLDTSNGDATGGGNDNRSPLVTQGFYIATTTATVYFNVSGTDHSDAGSWSSLIVLPLQ